METKLKIAGVLTAASLLLPAFALAALPVRQNTQGTASSTPAVNFCTTLPQLTAQINNRLAQSTTNLQNRQQEIQTKVQERQTTRTQQLTQARIKANQDRQVIYQQLMAKATTDAQKQAVITFQNTIEAAVTTRQTAVDAARQAYWSALDNALVSRKTAVDTARQNFFSAVQTALTTASSQCTAGTAPATVRQTFQAALQTAKTQFSANRKAVDKIGPQVKALVQTRNTAIKKAMDDFKKTAEQARLTLKTAFAK